MTTPDRSETPAFLIPLAWALVAVPLGYGLLRTLITASTLFTG